MAIEVSRAAVMIWLCCLIGVSRADDQLALESYTNGYAKYQRVAQNEAPAQNLREKADAGDVSAMYNLGYMYFQGEGVVQDYAAAKVWFERA